MTDYKRVFVISAPSGAGKTTLNYKLIEAYPEIEISISYTARKKRDNEVDGKDYYFISKEKFKEMIAENQMLEWAEVHDNLYGTSKDELMRIESEGRHSLLEIDVQGWITARKKLKKATAIFILPPSVESLWQRLESRGTDDLKVRWRRILNAKKEIEKADIYDYFIINDDLDKAYMELESIIIQGEPGKIDVDAGKRLCDELLKEFDQASWFQELKATFGEISL